MKITFTAKVQAIGRVAIPLEIRQQMGIRQGDMVTVNIEAVFPKRKQG